MNNEFPRRNRLDLNTSAEKAIYDAIQEVEKAGADPKLTDVVVMLGKAKDLLSDYVDDKIKIDSKPKIDRVTADFISGATDAGFDD